MKAKLKTFLKKSYEHCCEIGLVCTLMYDLLTFLLAYLTKNAPTVLEIVFTIVMTTFYLVMHINGMKKKIFVREIKKIIEQDLYFHGEKISKYIYSNTFCRLEEWLGEGLCFELAPIAMIMLKDNKSARLCQGAVYDKDGNFETSHVWVEFKIPLNGWWVADLAWVETCFARRKFYKKKLNSDGHIEEKWDCPHDVFFGIELVDILMKAIKKAETSNVLLELSAFGNENGKYGFSQDCYLQRRFIFSDGTFMLPHYRSAKRPISTEIIQDFVKKTSRLQPKMRSLRKTYATMHHALP